MLASALGAIGGRLDSSFLTAFWLPAFVGILGVTGITALATGWSEAIARLASLQNTTQAFLALGLLLGTTLAACLLRALARPVSSAFAGDLLPKGLQIWMRGQQVRKHLAAESTQPGATAQATQFTPRQAPRELDSLRATRIGNLMAVAAEHPRLAYAMDGCFWWPRLAPVVPTAYQATLADTQAPMLALLNLSVVFLGLAGLALLEAVLLHLSIAWAAAIFLFGLLLANLCYRAAVAQAQELSLLLCVGFDLYRHDILRMMDIAIPDSLDDERALWQSLTNQVVAAQAIDEMLSEPRLPIVPADCETAADPRAG